MNIKAEVPDIRCIDDDNGGSGLYYECTKVKVWLNLEEGTELYSGQLLLIQEKTNNDSVSKTSPQRSARRTRTSSNSKRAQNMSECSKIFSVLKEADIQFNSSTSLNPTSKSTATIKTAPPTTESASTKTTDSSVAASKGSLSALKTKTTTAFPTSSYTKTVSTSSSDTLNGASGKASLFGASAKLDSKAPFPVPTKNETATAVKTVSSTAQSSINSISFATTTSAGVDSQFSFTPVFLGPNLFSKTNTSPSGFTLEPEVTKTTPELTVTSSGKFGSVSPFKTSPAASGSSLWTKQNDCSSSSALKAKKKGVALGSGDTDRAAREECMGASKYPTPSNDMEYSGTESDSEEDDKKVTATVKKVRSDGRRERGSDHRRQREGRMGRKTDNSLENELLRALLRCFQIQHPLYKILAAKLRNMESKSELQASENMSGDSKTGDIQSLLFPLEALLRCSDIQLGLHHGLSVVINETNAREGDEKDHTFTNTEQVSHMIYDKDELLIESRSLMNQTQFAKFLVCLHLSNPYALKLRFACGEDRIAIPSRSNWFSWYVPHGEGKLVNLDGNLIYEGQWKKGKRWGYGKAFIFSGNELSASKKQYGIYEGNWWNNMRHGHGRLVFASCAVYEGEWQYDLMSGVGAMHSPDGSVLEGLWDEGEPSGCGMFTWPNGAVEYREYQNGQVIKVLQSPDETKRFSPLNEVMREYSVLRLKCQMLEEEKLKLVQSESQLMAQRAGADNYKAKLKQANQEKVKQLRAKFVELLEKQKKSLIESHQQDMKDMSERHDKKIKDLEEKIHQVEVELESKKSDLMCQICFERERNCILMPCSHLLYCQTCIAKLHADSKPARCPSCRGMINSQINCNINH